MRWLGTLIEAGRKALQRSKNISSTPPANTPKTPQQPRQRSPTNKDKQQAIEQLDDKTQGRMKEAKQQYDKGVEKSPSSTKDSTATDTSGGERYRAVHIDKPPYQPDTSPANGTSKSRGIEY